MLIQNNLKLPKLLQLRDFERIAPMPSNRPGPSVKLFFGQAVAADCLVTQQQPMLDRCDHDGLAAGDPAGVDRRQIGQGQNGAVPRMAVRGPVVFFKNIGMFLSSLPLFLAETS